MGDDFAPDFISDLPEIIIDSILSRLPIRHAIRTSILSSKWRLALNICAPNLKYLHLEEDKWMNVFLANTPLLKSLKVKIYKYDDIAEYNEQSPTSNFIKLLGRVPHLEKLVGDIDFVKYLSIGNDPGILPVTYDNLKIIELYQVSFEDMKELLFVLRLIMNAPNLTELHLSGRKNTLTVIEAPDLDFWKQKYLLNCTLKQLKVAKMTKMSGLPPEMEFIKFLLASSPVLKMMSIAPFSDFVDGILCMSIELLRFRRASAQAEILFVQEDQDDPVP